MSFTAFLGIFTIVTQSLNGMMSKILAVCGIISFSSILAMICSIFIDKKNNVNAGWAGIIISILSGIYWMILVLIGTQGGVPLRFGLALVLAAIGYVHCLGILIPRLSGKVDWVIPLANIFNATFYCQLIFAFIVGSEEAISIPVIGVDAVLMAFGVIAIPIISKLYPQSKFETVENNDLFLSHLYDDIYRDRFANRYKVNKLK